MSTLVDLLVLKVGTRITKILAEAWLGKDTSTIVGDAMDVLFGRFQSTADRRKAKRELESLGEKIAEDLLPLFEKASQQGHLNAEAVILEMESTLARGGTTSFIIRKNLDPEAILFELRTLRPLPRNQYSEAEEQLYGRALAHAIRRLVQVAAQLPQFHEAFAARSLQEIQRIASGVGEILEGVHNIEFYVGARVNESRAQDYEVNYRLAIQRNLNYLELFGIDLRPESRRQKLSVGYVSLTLESRTEKALEPLPAEALFNRLSPLNGHLLIRGEAGSGKSTLFRWAAIQAAGHVPWRDQLTDLAGLNKHILDDYETPNRNWRSFVPFLIPLRYCGLGRLPSLEELPQLIAGSLGRPPVDWVKGILSTGRGLVLLDGVDEIPNSLRETTRREIADLVRQYPDNLFVISTRPKAVDASWLKDLGFQEARINPMSEVDRGHFIDRWHQAVEIEAAVLGRTPEELSNFAGALKEHLASSPPVALLATNPLLCAMICALYRDRNQKLPERQRELCEALCEALTHRRERESGLDLSKFPEAYSKLDYAQKRAALQELAHYMVLNGYSSIPFDDAQEKIGIVLRSLPGHSVNDARIVTESLVERSGILREETQSSIGFVHNALKELLAGDYFADQNDAGLLASRAMDPDWQPTILFAVGTSRRGFATRVIQKILDRAPSTYAGRSTQVMALRCRSSALFVEEELDQRLQRLASELFPPRSSEDAEALATYGEPAIQFLRFKDTFSDNQAASCVRTLRLIGTPSAKEVLRGYLNDRRSWVVSELLQAVNPLEVAYIQDLLSAGMYLPEGIRSQVTDASPLARLNHLEILALSETQIVDVTPLAKMSSLRSLFLRGTFVSDISPLAHLANLRALALTGTQLTDLSPLASLPNLRSLDLGKTKALDISPLARLSTLQSLDLTETQVKDISPLSALSNLETLALDGTQISDISPLSALLNLESLHLRGTQVTDISPLAGLFRLQRLYLGQTVVTDASPLAALANLKVLDLSETGVKDISALSSLRSCRIIWSGE